MKNYLLRRIVALVPVMFIVAVAVFMLIHITPGDPAAFLLGPDATPADIQRVRAQLGLNEPLLTQFAIWLRRVVTGDLGHSIFLQIPVPAAILERLEPTTLLTLLASLLAIGLGVPAGILAAARHNTAADQAVMSVGLLGVSMPSFWLGLNLIFLFGVRLRWLPVAGYVPLARDPLQTLEYLVMPAFTLGFIEAALIARMTRATMLEVLGQDFVRTARAKGLAERVVIYRHALRNALIPIVTVVGNTFVVLMGGAIVTETVFNVPGLGRLVIQSVLRRDYPLIQGTVLFVASLYVLINLLVDLVYVWIDPRVKYA